MSDTAPLTHPGLINPILVSFLAKVLVMTEQQPWQVSGEAAEQYETILVPAIFQEWAPRLADAAYVSPGNRVLDVACGTGVVARECATRVGATGQVTGLDLNDGMLSVARQVRPEIRWLQGDAASMLFDDASFDVVTCQFALMYFPDRTAALREMWRVLAPGGRMVVAVWGPVEDIDAYVTLTDLTARHAGLAAADIVRSPFVLGDKKKVAAIFQDARLKDFSIDTQHAPERFASIEAFVEAEIRGSPAAELVNDVVFAALVGDAEKELAFCRKEDGRVEFDCVAHVVTVKKT